ncbi:hypothetical protein ACJX0J_027803 [Zea mays]
MRLNYNQKEMKATSYNNGGNNIAYIKVEVIDFEEEGAQNEINNLQAEIIKLQHKDEEKENMLNLLVADLKLREDLEKTTDWIEENIDAFDEVISTRVAEAAKKAELFRQVRDIGYDTASLGHD